ncbi:SubName: Full=Uncharacterized protein {ECO:0000313/EMBL:CCA67723.1} [Serendipita indica DSM 11827]|nr:SubName: Full=Uncharacterized protein {ECO:0000313/EMBL:CCA67723.1} [Serendipita indica DSM 11827]
MSAAYRTQAEPYRDSLRSAQTSSVYSEDSSYLESSPLDSIIRDYPVVPGASPNAFKFSPASYGSTPRTGSSVTGKFQQAQQHARGAEAPLRLREQTAGEYSDAPTPKQASFVQTQDRPGSSPLLHARFTSPSDSFSDDPRDPRGSHNDGKSQDNFIDLRDSGSYTPPEQPSAHQAQPDMHYFTHSSHGVPPRSGHGVTPMMNFGPLKTPSQPDHLKSRFSPVTPDVDADLELVAHTNQSAQSQQQHGGRVAYKDSLQAGSHDYFNRGSWQTQSSAANPARETWMTTTSGVTIADPFSFRHYESPQIYPNEQPRTTALQPNSAPEVVVHRPLSEAPSLYTDRGDYVDLADSLNNPVYAIVPPSPVEPVPQGRMPSKVPVTTRYNFSRPLRSDVSVMDRTSAETGTGASARASEYSTMSSSTDLPHTIMGFPEPPIPANLPPSMLSNMHNNPNDPPLTRRAIARMSIPKTVPNAVVTHDLHSPSPETRELALPSNSPNLQPMQLSSSPGRHTQQNNLGSRSLSPIPDTERSPSPSSVSHGSPRFNAPSPLPGPPRTYDVPYSYSVTITDHQVQFPPGGYNAESFQNNHTRYSMGGTAHPPAPREVAALRSSPPPVGPRPGSGLSVYSRYSFYSVGDLPDSAAPTPKGWEKERYRQGGKSSPSRSDSTPTPTKEKRKDSDDYQGLPYLSGTEESVPNTQPPQEAIMSPQESLLLGISHHEANRLQESAYWFERAATEHGGCGVGMLMWGLSLRHAWGVEKDERAAFWWLKRAAGCAVEDMERSRQMKETGSMDPEAERDRKAVQSELVLAVYEVGQCFFHGWGVETDKKLAVSYFQVAARLGDVDAQLELGFCFANGKGCKKDLKEAARWYRAAVAQGASNVGLAWIYKAKYGGDGASKEEENPIDRNGRIMLPNSKSSTTTSLKSGSGKSDSPRKLRKPPPRSKTPNGRARSPARTDVGSHIDSP